MKEFTIIACITVCILNVHRKVKFDHFDKAFCVMKLTGEHCSTLAQSTQRLFRVDLIVVPVKQYYCALLSWTGSKVRQPVPVPATNITVTFYSNLIDL